MKKYIKLLGTITSRDRLIEIYCSADIFVLPSLLETFSLSVLEAWAAGLAVIATPLGVIAEVGKDGENVLIVPPRDAGHLYLAMLNLMNDEYLRKKIADNGRELVRKNFTWGIIYKTLEKIYLQVID